MRPWAGAWAGGAGVLLRRCALTSASAPPPHLRAPASHTSGPWALRPRLRHTTQHAVFFLQFRITAIYVMLSTCVKSCPRVPLRLASLGSRLTLLFRSSIQVMMRPARLPTVQFGPLIPTPWLADRDRVHKNLLLPRAPSPSAVKEKRLQRAPVSVRQTGDARPLSAARTRHAVQR